LVIWCRHIGSVGFWLQGAADCGLRHPAGRAIDKFNASAIAAHYGSASAGLQTGVLEGESNILFMLAVPEPRLDAVLADVNKLMKRGHHLAAFVSDTKVMRREKFDE